MLSKPDAIVFDWDDTIITAWHVIHHAINKTLIAFGEEPWSKDEAAKRIGPPAKVLFTGLFGEENWEKADKIFIESYKDSIKDNIKLYEGAEDTLKHANELGIKCFIVSTKRGTVLKQEVEALGLSKYFVSIVGTGDAEKDKPHKESVDLAFKDSDIHPSTHNVWFIGDGVTDLKCAYNSGCVPIFVETKLPEDKEALYELEVKISEFAPKERFKDIKEFDEFIVNNFNEKKCCLNNGPKFS